MSKVLIAGGTGFVGRLIADYFVERGHEVVVLTRGKGGGPGTRSVTWDGSAQGEWTKELEGSLAIINLCGSPITARWTPENLKRMRDSRIGPTEAIGKAISECKKPPKAWINASAIGFYGDSGSRPVTEATAAGKDTLGVMCQAWEAATATHECPGTQITRMRMGVVLARGGGFLEPFVNLTKMFLGGAIGSGKQYVSWIHGRDLARLAEWIIEIGFSGAVNATAPNPVTMSGFMANLRGRFSRPAVPGPPMPLFNMICALMKVEPRALVSGTRALPEIASARGFRFEYPTLDAALDDLVESTPAAWLGSGSAAVSPSSK